MTNQRADGAEDPTSVPERYRLPAAPDAYAGREREAEWLLTAIERAPLAVVWGPGGYGKTALVAHVLANRPTGEIVVGGGGLAAGSNPSRRGDSAAPRDGVAAIPDEVRTRAGQRRASEAQRDGQYRAFSVRISLRTADPGRDGRLDILQALAEMAHLTRIDWASLADDADGLTAAILGLAENPPRTIVVDDAQHIPGDRLRELALQIARYARDSRWIIISRSDPHLPELPGQVLPLGPMRHADLVAIARALQPDVPEAVLQAAVSRAAGSPWQLKQILSRDGDANTALATDDGQRPDTLTDLNAETMAFLTALSVVNQPLPPHTIASFAAVPNRESLSQLVQRGLLEETAGGYQVHDVARDELRERSGADARSLREHVGRALAGQLRDGLDPFPAPIEAIRLLADGGAFEVLGQLLARHADGLFSAGLASRIWPLVEPLVDPHTHPFRLRCALEVGDRRAIFQATEPKSESDDDRIVWSRILQARHDIEGAQAVARAVASRAADPTMAFEGGAIAARCLLQLDRGEEALELIVAQPAPDERAKVHQAILETQALHALHRLDEVRDRVARLVGPARQLTGPRREEAVYALAHVAYRLGCLREARELTEHLSTHEAGWSPALFAGRRTAMLHVGVALYQLRLDEGEALLSKLDPFMSRSPYFRPRWLLAGCLRRALSGDFDGYAEALAAATEDARRARDGEMVLLAEGLLAEWQRLSGAPCDFDPSVAPSRSGSRADLRTLVELEQTRWAIRAGHRCPLPAPSAKTTIHPGLWSLHTAAASHAAVLAGDATGAAALCRTAIESVQAAGHRAREAELWMSLCEALALLDDDDALGDAADALQALGRSAGSARYGLEAAFYTMFAVVERMSPAALERMAQSEDVAPTAARRARALLGEQPQLDAIDRLLLARIQRRLPWLPAETHGSRGTAARHAAGWGLDDLTQRVWFEDGSEVDMGRRPLLFRMLTVLADAGGSATKEALVAAVWQEDVYHPLQHDNRLHSAVRKLRRMIEQDPRDPKRFLTTEEGYALAAPVRRIRSR